MDHVAEIKKMVARAVKAEARVAELEGCSEGVATRLQQLRRYSTGTADEGGGYLYDYADLDSVGGWVKWDDIQKIVVALRGGEG